MLWVVLPLAAQPIASQKSCELPKAARVQEKKVPFLLCPTHDHAIIHSARAHSSVVRAVGS